MEKSTQKTEIASSVKDLPPLKEGYMRYVHITAPEVAEELVKTGLRYEKYGMLMSTAKGWP